MSISGGTHLVSSNHLHGLPVKKTPSTPFLSSGLLLKNKWLLYFQPLPRLPVSLTCQAGSSNNDRRNPRFPKKNYKRPPPPKRKFKNLQDREALLEASQMLSSQNGRSTVSDAVIPTKSESEKEILEVFKKHVPQLGQGMKRNHTFGLNATMMKRGKERESFQSLLELLNSSGAEQKRPTNTDGTKGNTSDRVKFLDYDEDSGEDSDGENIDENSDPENDVSDVLDPEPVWITPPRPPSSFSRRSPVPVGKYESMMPSDTRRGETQILRKVEKSGSESLFYESESGVEQSEAPHREEKVVNLDTLKVTELREIAKSRGLKGYSKMKKTELVEQLSLS